MSKRSPIIISIILAFFVWNSVAQDITIPRSHNPTTISCDSIYPNRNYRITLTIIDSTGEEDYTPNTLFTLSRLTKRQPVPIFSDSIFSRTRSIEFADFNNDAIPDILVQNISDVRSNETYYLYMVDTVQNKLKKIKGFEAIKNPTYLPRYNLVSNYVMSGRIWTRFYEIQGDTIKDFDIVIYDNQTNDGSYERDFKKSIRAILKKERNSR